MNPTAEQLIAADYYQISRRHRLVARLPDGMDGHQALRAAIKSYDGDVSPHEETWIQRLSERDAADHFLRVYTCYAPWKDLLLELDPVTFEAFRRLGGKSAR